MQLFACVIGFSNHMRSGKKNKKRGSSGCLLIPKGPIKHKSVKIPSNQNNQPTDGASLRFWGEGLFIFIDERRISHCSVMSFDGSLITFKLISKCFVPSALSIIMDVI